MGYDDGADARVDDLNDLKRWLAAAASFGARFEVLDEWQVLRACPIAPAGRVLLVVGGLRDISYLHFNAQCIRERRAHPELLRMATDAAKAASIVLYRRTKRPAQSPAPLLHLAYVAHHGRLQVISYTASPIVAASAPRHPTPPSPALRLPGWLEPLRPVVAAILGAPLGAPPQRPLPASASGARWRGPLTGPLAS